MAKSGKEAVTLIFTLLVTLGIVGGGWWFFTQKDNQNGVVGDRPNPGNLNPFSKSGQPNSDVAARISYGNKILIAEDSNPDKQAGVAAIASGDLQTAITKLEASLAANRNDPEALIYLNNAKAMFQGNSRKIVASVPIGSSVDAAKEILRGIAQVQNSINQTGGINGSLLEVAIADDGNDAAIARQVANDVVAHREVLAVVGSFGSSTTLAAAEVYQQGGLVQISPTSTAVELSNVGDYIFRTVPSDRFAANTLARYMLNQLQRQNAAVFFNSQSDYSNSLKSEFTVAVLGDGGRVVGEYDLSASNFDAAASINQAQQNGAEVLMLAANSDTINQAFQAIAVNRGGLPLLGGDSLYRLQTLQIGGANAEGMVLAVPWHILADPNAEFPSEAARLWGGDVNWRTAMAYDATKAIVAGLSQANTREELQKALASPGFSATGAATQVQFQPSGDRTSPAILVEIVPGKRSGAGYDFAPVSNN